jgi:hypothetical protein
MEFKSFRTLHAFKPQCKKEAICNVHKSLELLVTWIGEAAKNFKICSVKLTGFKIMCQFYVSPYL